MNETIIFYFLLSHIADNTYLCIVIYPKNEVLSINFH